MSTTSMESFTAFVSAIAMKKSSLPLRVDRYLTRPQPPTSNSSLSSRSSFRKRVRDDEVATVCHLVNERVSHDSQKVSSQEVPHPSSPVPNRVQAVNPYSCELLSKSTGKGFYESRYADIPLDTLGFVPFYDEGKFVKPRAAIGQLCCYLKLGTALVITGTVVEVHEGTAQVAPERGQHAPVEWISLTRLFLVPENLSEMRKKVGEKVMVVLATEVPQR